MTTDLTGKDVDQVMGAFELNEDGTRVLHCPRGYEPKSAACLNKDRRYPDHPVGNTSIFISTCESIRDLYSVFKVFRKKAFHA